MVLKDSHLNKKILIVDDDEGSIYLIKGMLEKAGHTDISSCQNCSDGFKKLLFSRPDLLIMDIILPESDGFKLSQSIDVIHDYKIPTIFISADKSYEKMIGQFKADKDVDFLSKPIDKIELLNIVERILVKHLGVTVVADDRKKVFTKPKVVKILALLHLIEPLMKVLYFKYETGFEFSAILSNIFQVDGIKNFFEFWLLFPLAGVALYIVKKWAYVLFIFLEIYAIVMHVTYTKFMWPYVSEFPHVSSLVLLVFNILVIVYFLLPSVRRPYFDKRFRHWEKERFYKIRIPCVLVNKNHDEYFVSEIFKISRDSAYVNCEREIEVGNSILLNFTFYSFNFSLQGKVNSLKDKEIHIIFNAIQYGDRLNMLRLMRALKILNL